MNIERIYSTAAEGIKFSLFLAFIMAALVTFFYGLVGSQEALTTATAGIILAGVILVASLVLGLVAMIAEKTGR